MTFTMSEAKGDITRCCIRAQRDMTVPREWNVGENLQGRTAAEKSALHVILGMGHMKQVTAIWMLQCKKSTKFGEIRGNPD